MSETSAEPIEVYRDRFWAVLTIPILGFFATLTSLMIAGGEAPRIMKRIAPTNNAVFWRVVGISLTAYLVASILLAVYRLAVRRPVWTFDGTGLMRHGLVHSRRVLWEEVGSVGPIEATGSQLWGRERIRLSLRFGGNVDIRDFPEDEPIEDFRDVLLAFWSARN